MSAAVAVDLAIAAAMLWLAWRLLADDDLVRGAILFIAFGLLAALAWARLDAPDIALAEAAIGAALTGVLLLDAAAELTRRRERGQRHRTLPPEPRPGPALGVAAAILAAGVGGTLLWALADLPAGTTGLLPEVEAALADSGVAHGVTGVLLAFRAWDTLLEVAVLLGAVIAVLAVVRAWGPALPQTVGARVPLALWLGRLLAPLIVLVAGYLLWAGGAAPGGAFQAGALLAGAALLCVLSGAVRGTPRPSAVRGLAAAGVAAFVGAVIASGLAGPELLRWPGAVDYELILGVELAVAVAVGAGLAAAFFAIGAAGRPGRDR